ncbi:hypothetical protein D0T51_04025 [Parabacteroides sp. 52]|uniref:TonB-dependent receptor plug domain-containing protein n=1 Tax=unclassified Parabacteroides TaxID=2649774 RepID=UPI0013D02CFE|nr:MULTISPECIES: TonB-dependent receptor plug domain-containing protein [unclassified Parabacteroides]MDH6534401.1 hypothetical protein [Parabacteroides sp. PM5-20]NDV54900.1 hypothetical protein [Parabacteroides sp. 52]
MPLLKDKQSEILLLCLLFLLPCSLAGQKGKEAFINETATRLYTQQQIFPQEKVHLHTDRNTYLPGERIWFKAYLRDAADIRVVPVSRYVYVELISPVDTLIHRVKLLPTEGLHKGYLDIPLELEEADYTLCAYTKNMQNVDDAYFFRKRLHIGRSTEVKEEETYVSDYKVAVFPEGGYLLEGALCRVAFKAVNAQGQGEEIVYAELADQTGALVKEMSCTTHLGMGSFAFIPEKGKTYVLNCRNAEGAWQYVHLPEARNDLCGIEANWRNDAMLAVGLRKASGWQKAPLYLLIHKGGDVLYTGAWDHSTPYFLFPKDSLPQGILHVLLLNESRDILNERLLFGRKDDETPHLQINTDREKYATREKITLSFALRDTKDKPLPAHLSVAITDDKAVNPDSTVTIQSTLLLTSELKGYIENPGYYFNHPSAQTDEALDHLMMTQAWRRYDIPKVLHGEMTYPRFMPETGPSISGRAIGLVSSKGVKNSQVSLLSPRDTLFALLDVDDTGRFNFTGYEYADSTTMYFQAYTKKGTDRLRLKVDRDTFPVIKSLETVSQLKRDKKVELFSDTIKRSDRYDLFGVRVIDLPEVTATAFNKKEEKPLSIYTISATQIITQEEIERYHQPNLEMALSYMPGVREAGRYHVILTGGAKGPALTMLDGMRVDELDLTMITMETVKQVEIIAPYKATIFGSTAADCGVVNIITRYDRPSYAILNAEVLTPLGVQKPVEFYTPLYDSEIQKRRPEMDYRTTICWKPDVWLDTEGNAFLDFYTSDAFPTSYTVIVEGITPDGQLIRSLKQIDMGAKTTE